MTENFRKAIEWAKKACRITFITHDGRSHADEVYTIALALALLRKAGAGFEFTVMRLSQPKLPRTLNYGEFMIDIGKKDNGVTHIDHHQYPPSHNKCSLSILVESWAPELLEFGYFKSLVERVSIQDTEGLAAYRIRHRIKENLRPLLMGEHVITDNFMFNPIAKTQELASWMLQNIINLSKDVSNLDDWVEEHKEVRTIKGINVMFLTGSPDSDNPSLIKHIFRALSRHAAADNAMVSISQPDIHKGEYSFYRYHPEPKYVDFNLCKNLSEVVATSIPPEGFSMRVKTDNKDRLVNIMEQSIVVYGKEPDQSVYQERSDPEEYPENN